MLTIVRRLWHVLFPFERGRTPVDYANQTLDLQEHKDCVAALVAAATAVTDEKRMKEFRDIANAKNADEASRQASILTRAQNLFVALALFGVLLTFGTSLFTQTTQRAKWELWVGLLFVVYILAQITIMVANILKAVGPIGYAHAGSSDLTGWLEKPTDAGFYRAQALLTLDHYRRATLNNSWRFGHLESALKGLRNIVVALSSLILCLFVAGIAAPPPAPPAAPQIRVIVPCRHGHWWCHCEQRAFRISQA
ncbi:MAG: hypothetical protein ABSH33_24545 [Steroidobacteraceae bacterium]|jgi:hypothetical protein